MKRINHHALFLILAACVTVLVGATYAYMYYAIGASVFRAAAARSAINADLANKSREQNFLNTYNETANDRARLPSFFIPADRVVTFIEVVESMSKDSGATVALTAIGSDNLEGSAPGTQGTVRAQVGAVGSWTAVMRALKLAELLPYKISISNVSLTTSGGSVLPPGGKTAVRSWNLSFDLVAAMILPYASSTPAK